MLRSVLSPYFWLFLHLQFECLHSAVIEELQSQVKTLSNDQKYDPNKIMETAANIIPGTIPKNAIPMANKKYVPNNMMEEVANWIPQNDEKQANLIISNGNEFMPKNDMQAATNLIQETLTNGQNSMTNYGFNNAMGSLENLMPKTVTNEETIMTSDAENSLKSVIGTGVNTMSSAFKEDNSKRDEFVPKSLVIGENVILPRQYGGGYYGNSFGDDDFDDDDDDEEDVHTRTLKKKKKKKKKKGCGGGFGGGYGGGYGY